MLAIVNLALVRQNRALLRAAEDSVTIRELSPGDPVPPVLSGIDVVADRYVSLDLRTARTTSMLLYVSAHCPPCVESMPRLRKVAETVAGSWQVVWISKDPLPDARAFVAQHQIADGHVLTELPWRLYQRLGLHVVPTTVIVGPDGVVQRIWHGPVEESDLQEILAFFTSKEVAEEART